MSSSQTAEKMRAMRMGAMATAFEEQQTQPRFNELSFEERVSMLVDREWSSRDNRRLTLRLDKAKLKIRSAAPEDIDYRHPRGLDRALMRTLETCDWARHHQNILLTGPTGSGKTWLSCALTNKACREGFSALYFRAPRLLHTLAMSRADGSYAKLLDRLARIDVLLVDDWGMGPLTDQDRRDLLEVLDDRHGIRSTIVTSQLPLKAWHESIGEPTMADAILERLIHNAHKVALKLAGPSMRERLAPKNSSRNHLTQEDAPA
jgi:DNA replication protein DnaC